MNRICLERFLHFNRILLYSRHKKILIFGTIHRPHKLVQKHATADIEEKSPLTWLALDCKTNLYAEHPINCPDLLQAQIYSPEAIHHTKAP